MPFNWIQIGSLFMFLAVTLGAFGAHMLKSRLSEYGMTIFTVGSHYHIIHALAMILVGWLVTQTADPKVIYAGWCFVAGVALFSGSLYLLAITGLKWLGAITPLGGLLFLTGWFLLIIAKYPKWS